MAEFSCTALLPLGHDEATYRKITEGAVEATRAILSLRPGGLAERPLRRAHLLQNSNIAAGGILPMCQDTSTAIVMGKRGQGQPGR